MPIAHTRRVRRLFWCALLAAACARPPVPAVVTIQSPEDGAMGSGPLKVTLAATGVTIAPVADQRAGGAHFHLFLDVDPSPAGAPIPAGVAGVIHLGGGQSEYTFDSLSPGNHRVIVMLGDNGHVPLPGQKTDTLNYMAH